MDKMFGSATPAQTPKPAAPDKKAAPGPKKGKKDDGARFEMKGHSKSVLSSFMDSREKATALNLMVVGESGLGKTTSIRNLFGFDILKGGAIQGRTDRMTSYKATGYGGEENAPELDLEVVDTPGYGDHANLSKSITTISNELRRRLRSYALNSMHPVDSFRDERIHLILYFVAPHRFKGIDQNFIKKISQYANVAVVASKADTMTEKEIKQYKTSIMETLEKRQSSKGPLQGRNLLFGGQPYACISEDRSYLFGKAESENVKHSEFPILREDVFGPKMGELKQRTQILYKHVYNSGQLRGPWYQSSKPYLGALLGVGMAELAHRNDMTLHKGKLGKGGKPGKQEAHHVLGAVLGMAGGYLAHYLFDKI